MDKIVIFTNKYPYEPPNEQFLHDEIRFLLREFDITIIPLSRRINIKFTYDIDKRINVIFPKRRAKIVEIVFGFLSLLFHFSWLFKDMHFKRRHININSIFYAIKEYIKAFSLSLSLKNTLKGIEEDNNQKILFYSYWFGSSLAAVNIYKKRSKNKEKIFVVSRAHGLGDLYTGESNNCFLFNGFMISNYTSRIFTISEDGKRYLEGYGLQNVFVSRLGVKKSLDNLEPLSNSNSRKLIVSCSTVNKNKRVGDIAKIICLLSSGQIEWHHFGDGDELKSIKDMCDGAKSKSFIIFEGMKRNDEIISFYKKEKPVLFINLSLVEGIPVSIMEAMSCKIPCLATNVGAVDEIVSDKKNGYLVERDYNSSAVLEIIKNHLELNDDCLNELRNNAYLTWSKKYNSEDNFNNFIEQLKSIIH